MKTNAPAFASRRRRTRRGSTLVETAICLSFVLLPLALGGLQFGLVLTTTHAMEQISREAGRFAAINYGQATFDNDDKQGDSANQASSLRNYIKHVAADNGIPYNDISGVSVGGKPASGNITVSPATGSRFSGQPITVSITYPMKKRSILGTLGTMPFAPANGGASSLGFLTKDYTVASTFIME